MEVTKDAMMALFRSPAEMFHAKYLSSRPVAEKNIFEVSLYTYKENTFVQRAELVLTPGS